MNTKFHWHYISVWSKAIANQGCLNTYMFAFGFSTPENYHRLVEKSTNEKFDITIVNFLPFLTILEIEFK